MWRGRRPAFIAGLVLGVVGVCGCVLPPPPSAQDMLDLLSYAIMVPEQTCAELRDEFGVDFLPLAETPADIGLDYQEDYVTNAFGWAIRVWYIPSAANRGVVVLSTGSAGGMPCHLYLPLLLNSEGWSVVMYDYQGFGGSEGSADLQSLPGDLNAVLDWTLPRTGTEQVTLIGYSLGSVPSVALAVRRPDVVNAVVIDSPVALGAQLARFNPLLRGQSAWVRSLLDRELITEDVIGDLPCPLLVYEHGRDVVTLPKHVELLYERAPSPKMMVRFPELGHAQSLYFATDAYMGYLTDFLHAAWAD